MIQASEINYEKSIQTGWLTFSGSMRHYRSKSFLKHFDQFTFLLAAIVLLVSIFLTIYKEADFNNPNDKAFSVLGIIISPLILYAGYRKITENKFLQIPVQLSIDDSVAVIKSILRRRGADEIHGNEKCIIAKEISSLNENSYKQTIILISGSTLYLNITRQEAKMNYPVLFSHLFLKSAIKKELRIKAG